MTCIHRVIFQTLRVTESDPVGTVFYRCAWCRVLSRGWLFKGVLFRPAFIPDRPDVLEVRVANSVNPD